MKIKYKIYKLLSTGPRQHETQDYVLMQDYKFGLGDAFNTEREAEERLTELIKKYPGPYVILKTYN